MKNFFKNKNNIIIGLCAVVVLMGIGFAAFSQRLQIGDTTVTNSDWNVYIKSVTAGTPVGKATGSGQVVDRATAKLTANLQSPGDSVTYTITVANDGNIDAVLDVITLSASNNDSVIKYSYAGITEDEELLAESEKSFTVTIAYDFTKTGTVTEEQKQNTLTLDLDFVQKTSGSPEPEVATFNMKGIDIPLVTTGDGLYADTYENGRYVYRGADPDNYVCLSADETCSEDDMYRIVAQETDGTLKVIKNVSIGTATWNNASSLAYVTKKRNNYEIDNKVYSASVGQGGCTVDVTWGNTAVSTYLNDIWYESLISVLPNDLLIVEGEFDIGIILEDDSLSDAIAEEKASTWNGNVGLISITDYIRASTNSSCNSIYDYSVPSICYEDSETHNWLYSDDLKMTITIGSSSTCNYYIYTNGSVTTAVYSNQSYNVYPVMFLNQNVEFSGSGTEEEPYEIAG